MASSPVNNLSQMKRKLKLKFLTKKKNFFKLYVDGNYLVMDVRSLGKSCKEDVEHLDTKKRIMSMLIMSNYYYILSSEKIYLKHLKRLKCYKRIKNSMPRWKNWTGKEIHFRILSRIANRVSYSDLLQETEKKKKKNMAHFKDTQKEEETHVNRTSEGDPIHHYLLDAFEANYRAILDTVSWANLHALSSELQDFYIQKGNLICSHYTIMGRNSNNHFDLFFK
ncbi:Uncharacterized protein PCOAH_00015180 [Plasmodium coatneyi]|uniref:Uncharacterized protein n=1 Tax=Plasmodium coatneyi TaxID=208452 RepID=A0A1B1DWI3_9APIC|nr:Uncharacterized protein PCOAH_00015180 [Plasmodium coatneyi]ANQ07110.1 Uncharacterized protein PCOAH_00015180 [Plasmodium coatneyi]